MALVLIAAAVLWFLLAKLWPFTADDSFITFRYARNLAAGHGLTFNAGGSPAEGYTTFLWAVVLALPHLVFSDVVIFAKLTGVAATIGIGVLCFAFATRLCLFYCVPRPRIAGGLATLLFASYPATAVHAVSGMETALYTLLLSSFFLLLTVAAHEFTTKRARVLAILALLVGLTRPEGNLAAGAGLAVLYFVVSGARRKSLAVAVLTLYMVPGAIYFLSRFLYYGHLWPLPFYLKVAATSRLAGIPDVVGFGVFVAGRLGIPLLLGLVFADRRLAPAMASVAALTLFFLVPAHIMGYEFRYLFPVYPLGCVIAALGLTSLHSRLVDGYRGGRLLVRTAVTVAISTLLAMGLLSTYSEIVPNRRSYGAAMEAAHIRLGRTLAEFAAGPRTPVIAIADAGAVPYYSMWTTIDTYGLNEPDIAIGGKRDAATILGLQPDLLVLVSRKVEVFEVVPQLEWEQELLEASLERGMEPIRRLVSRHGYVLWIMSAPGTPLARHVMNQLPEG